VILLAAKFILIAFFARIARMDSDPSEDRLVRRLVRHRSKSDG